MWCDVLHISFEELQLRLWHAPVTWQLICKMQNAPSPRGLVGLLKMPEINEGVAADAYRSAEVWAPKTASQTDRYGIWCMVYGDGVGPTCWQRLLKITAGNLQNERTARLLPQFWKVRRLKVPSLRTEPIIKLSAPPDGQLQIDRMPAKGHNILATISPAYTASVAKFWNQNAVFRTLNSGQLLNAASKTHNYSAPLT